MKIIILRYAFDRKGAADNKNRKGLLQIEARERGTNKCVYISTGIRLLKNQFSDHNGFTCRAHELATPITQKARRIYNEIEAFVMSGKCAQLSDVKNWNKDESSQSSFIEFMRKELARRNPSDATFEHHSGLIRRLEGYGKIKIFADLTYENIISFDAFLRQTINSSATLHKRHSTLHYYIREAMNRELIAKDPYSRFKMPVKKSKEPVYLTEGEIQRIVNCEPGSEKLMRIKDLFVFQIFTGMAYIDAMQFSSESVMEIDGCKVIRSSRAKTDESFIILFLPEAENIAKKYDYHLPHISNQRYNDYLKIIQERAFITKKLTTHVARHTFATYLLNKGVPLETVSRAMGHANIKMTEHYAKMLGKKVIEDMKRLL
jgi:site-specific recombinase XerD